MTISLYPLDISQSTSIVSQLASHPYPARPAGFLLPESLFRASLHPLTPIAISCVYLVATLIANARNRASQGKPKDLVNATYALKQAVLAHNLFLALYSAWTAVNVVSRLVIYFAKGAQEGGLEGWTTAFCTVPIHDPSHDGLFKFIVLFYYSKFYEVIDSLILVLKGKKVSNLQVYHHAGAMLTMWAGARYSTTPIYIFAAFNGTIHAAMYSYYSATSLHVPVPNFIKRSMTSLQIFQLVFGMIIASTYLFVTYKPSAYPSHVLPSIGVIDVDSGNSSNRLNTFARHIAFNASSPTFSPPPPPSSSLFKAAVSPSPSSLIAIPALAPTEIRYKIEGFLNSNGRAPCVSSTGQAFAVALNVLYLLPLITLFVRFYIRSYLRKAAQSQQKKTENVKSE